MAMGTPADGRVRSAAQAKSQTETSWAFISFSTNCGKPPQSDHKIKEHGVLLSNPQPLPQTSLKEAAGQIPFFIPLHLTCQKGMLVVAMAMLSRL